MVWEEVIIIPQPSMSKLFLSDVAGVVSSSAQSQMWLFTPELCAPGHQDASSEMVPGTVPFTHFHWSAFT